MSSDPRKYFSVAYCDKGKKSNSAATAKRKGFLESITKLGDLEILNDVGFGKVGEGLRVLSAVSDSVRVGSSVVPGREGNETYNSTLGKIVGTSIDAVDQGANHVLDATGLGGAVASVGDFHPGVANTAYGQAKSIFQKVKQGNFELSDIPEYFSDLQNLEQLARGIFNTAKKPPKRIEACGASPYAVDLIAYAPKFNFLFVMDIQFNAEYQTWDDVGSSMAFVIKRSSRPAVEFEYEEVNMYNFRTRIPKRTVYPPVTMNFYDDNKNAAHLFYTAYMRAMSPIANMMTPNSSTGMYESNSMNFSKKAEAPILHNYSTSYSTPAGGGTGTSDFKINNDPLGYASSLGPLLGNNTSIIKSIRLYHVFDYGRLMNVYNFYNPRILTFTPSELNMAETGDGADFEFQFAYDSMFIEPGFSVQQGGDNKTLENLTSNRGTATYPIKPVFSDDDIASQDNSQAGLCPIAQEQQTSGFLSSIGTGLSNVTKGIEGAIGDAYILAAGTVSNAFKATSNFIGSSFK